MTTPAAATLQIYKLLFASIAEEMGVILRRSSFSPNIKERRDFSCAVFDASRKMISQASHIPVHLGSMPLSVQVAVESSSLQEGDMVILNDPYLGGTHLPDLTLVAPVFYNNHLVGYVANRAHHADLGGMTPGSMPIAAEIFQEGLIIPPVKLIDNGKINKDILSIILANVRTPQEREGDLRAQIAANQRGITRLTDFFQRYGTEQLNSAIQNLFAYTEKLTRTLLSQLPSGVYTFSDYLDNDGINQQPLKLQVKITIREDTATFDFTGSSPQCATSLNAVYAITLSAVNYVIRSLLDIDTPNNAGCMAPITVIAPEGTILNATYPAPVAAGNVEVSQRIVDVLLGALAQAHPQKIPAASQGTMNNITLGGFDTPRNTSFTYYETIGGGCGAADGYHGASATHSHMTNTLNTPVEALELAYPLQVVRYSIREDSGGDGQFRGGNGICREIQVLTPVRGTILSERRATQPYGLSGGAPGKCGENFYYHNGERIPLPGKGNFTLQKGDILCIHTPGGGGFGKKQDSGFLSTEVFS